MSETLSLQIARAIEQQPTNFDGFQTAVAAVDRISVTRALVCECGSDKGQLKAGEGDAEFPWLDPLVFICGGCGASRTFFDSNRDGYDGRFGHGSSYEQVSVSTEVACPACGNTELRVQCGLIYNIEASELDEDVSPEKSADYFDGLDMNAECTSCSRKFNVGSWELA